MIRVLLAAETAILRRALAAVLAAEPDFALVGDVGAGADLRAVVAARRPDVVVADIELGTEATLPRCRVLYLASPTRPARLRRTLVESNCGVVNHDASPATLIDAVRRAARGERVLDDEVVAAALSARDVPLSAREVDVLRLTATGATPIDIARQLCLSHRTVRNYLSAIKRKTGARSRVDVVRMAERAGWL